MVKVVRKGDWFLMRILIFSPNAAIWPHEKPLLEYAQELIQRDHSVSVLRCERHFSDFCTAMSAFGLGFNSERNEKEKICQRCIRSAGYIDKFSGLESISLDNLNRFDELTSRYLAEITPENWWGFEIDSVPIGRYAGYEFVLHNKLNSNLIPLELFDEYLSSLRYSIEIYFYAKEFFAKNSFDSILVYNRLYSLNKVFCEVAEKFGVSTYTLHASGSIIDFFEKVSIFKDDLTALTINKSQKWKSVSDRPIGQMEVKSVTDHFKGLFGAASPWVYSTKPVGISSRTLKAKVGAAPDSKVVLIATSSVDEIFAIKMIGIDPVDIDAPTIFPSQADWIMSTIEFLRDFPDVFLIIRVHPREFANKREGLNSSHGQHLKSLLQEVKHKNVYLNLPGDNLSLYDLLGATNLLLAGNSSAVPEFAALGVPVLCHESRNLTAFPPELAYWSDTKNGYFNKIINLLESVNENEKAIQAFRWYSFKINIIGEKTKFSSHWFNKIVFGIPRRIYSKFAFGIPLNWFWIPSRKLLKLGWEQKANSNIESILDGDLEGTFVTNKYSINSSELEEVQLIQRAQSSLLSILNSQRSV